MKKMTVRELTACGLFSAVMCVCSVLSVPSAVPFTLQNFAVAAVLLILGGRLGAFSVGAYILMGTAGLPVFSGFRGGAGVLVGPTGGYILGFMLMCGVYLFAEKWFGSGMAVRLSALVAGQIMCYAAGTVWYVVAVGQSFTMENIAGALSVCVLPFVIPDIVKLGAAWIVAEAVRKKTGIVTER